MRPIRRSGEGDASRPVRWLRILKLLLTVLLLAVALFDALSGGITTPGFLP